jgi:hypothetical protein
MHIYLRDFFLDPFLRLNLEYVRTITSTLEQASKVESVDAFVTSRSKAEENSNKGAKSRLTSSLSTYVFRNLTI